MQRLATHASKGLSTVTAPEHYTEHNPCSKSVLYGLWRPQPPS
jgi:hypothetical protein